MVNLLPRVVWIVFSVSKYTSYQSLEPRQSGSINTDQITGGGPEGRRREECRERREGGGYFFLRQKRELFTLVLGTWTPESEDDRKRLGLQSEIFNIYRFMILPRLTHVNIKGQCTRWNKCSPVTFAVPASFS